MSKPKIAIIGAGQVGATTAQRLIEKNLCDVVLFDIVEGLAQGKALDLMEAAPVEGHECKITGTTNYKDIQGAQIVVVTAGFPRKPGMTREDLLVANAKIIRSVSENLKKYTSNAIIITVTNPLDIMTQLLAQLTGFDKNRVFGMAGVLDSARMRFFIAEEIGCHPHEVAAMVLGGHGDLMVPVMSQVKVKGQELTSLSPEKTQAIIKRTQQGGAEIVALLKSGSAYYAPASSVAEMVRIILTNDQDTTLPVCAFCTGQYGLKDIYSGIPAKLNTKGIREIVELPLTDTEKKALQVSADKVRKGVNELAELAF